MARNTASTGLRTHNPRSRVGDKVLPGDVRQRHRALLMQCLFKGEPLSRADLARATGLTRVSVSDVVTELLELDLIEEIGTRPGTRVGKPATLVTVKYDGRSIVCLDLSDESEFRGAVINLEGEVLYRKAVKLAGQTGQAAVEIVFALAKELIKGTNTPILGIGVGTPGVVNAQGLVRKAPNLGWQDLDLPQLLTQELQYPAYVANDADTAVLAESTFGQGNGAGLILVQISHGVGAGILCDGILLRGPDGTAGEIGHVRISDDNVLCACGRTGCLEAFIATPHLRSRIAGKSEAQATQELTNAGQQLGQVLAPIVQALGILDITLFGPAELLDGALCESAQTTINAATSHFGDQDVAIRMSALGDDGVLIGAAAHVLGLELGLS
ncbi:ROK family protein [Jonesiaceae bacterium BS-20]|uniref:ROK family protein n=1 Tax=Jonesiaceae bacterium BS-20 TaxID=3120821 RepID=A0AAU7DTX1_9MICO